MAEAPINFESVLHEILRPGSDALIIGEVVAVHLHLALFSDAPPVVLFCALGLYAITSGGCNFIELVYPNELFATHIRATATGIVVALSRVGSATSTFLLPITLTESGIGAVMWLLGIVNVIGFAGDHPTGWCRTLWRGYVTDMRLGVLDIGSNSAQLQIVDVYPGAPPLPTQAVKQPTLLGEAFEADGSIDPAGVERVVQATSRAVDTARQSSVERLFAFATSAIRDTPNRDQILDLVESETGIRPQFLSGQDEARLTYLAVRSWYGWSAGRLLVVDIGGGSMEIMLGRDAEPELAVSLPLGAGRLTRAFLPGDPPTSEDLTALRKHIRDALREVADRLRWEGAPARAIGTSKTFKQLARLAGARPQRKGPFCRRTLAADDVAEWTPRLAKMPTEKRARLRGVSRSRARQVVAGALVAKATMKALDISSVEICPWALREGIVLHYLRTALDETWELPLQPVRPLDSTRTATVHTLSQ